MTAEIARWTLVVLNVFGTLCIIGLHGQTRYYNGVGGALTFALIMFLYWLGGMFPWDLQ